MKTYRMGYVGIFNGARYDCVFPLKGSQRKSILLPNYVPTIHCSFMLTFITQSIQLKVCIRNYFVESTKLLFLLRKEFANGQLNFTNS